jgi:hypothetical protein
MELSVWIANREYAALLRVRTIGLGIAVVLLLATVWLGIKEVKLASLPLETRGTVRKEQLADVFLRLWILGNASYLAKINANSLLVDIIGQDILETLSQPRQSLIGIPDGHPLKVASQRAIALAWATAFENEAPPLTPELLQDPWGAPYVFIPSESNCPHMPEWCPEDFIRSAGPDGVKDTADDITVPIPRHLYRHLAPK